MANSIYLKFKESLLSQSPSVVLGTDTIKAALVTSAYVFDEAHQFLSSVGTVVATSPALASKTFVNGTFDADNAQFTAVASGSTVTGVILFKDTGSAATSPLICYFDSATLGLPVVTNGTDITVRWSNGSTKILSLI